MSTTPTRSDLQISAEQAERNERRRARWRLRWYFRFGHFPEDHKPHGPKRLAEVVPLRRPA